MRIKRQIFIIHGGSTHSSRKDYLRKLRRRKIYIEPIKIWKDEFFDKELGKKFQIIRPRMPLSENAKYEDWKIHFDLHLPYLRHNIVLIGWSLGGIFLAKYLSENKFPKKIAAVFLISPPFDNTLKEELVGGFKLKRDLSKLDKIPNLTFMFSKDDKVVPISHMRKYRAKLSNVKFVVYKSKNGHFLVAKFPEITQIIKKL